MNNVTLLLEYFPAFGVTVNIFTLLLEIISSSNVKMFMPQKDVWHSAEIGK
jgi:hypothetical protein